MQQRGVPPLIVDWLQRFGRSEHCGDAERLYFDKHARRQLRKYVGASVFRKLHEHLDAYAIVNGGTVITVGTLYKRIKKIS